ncbi:MAG: YfhO family protein, partial [Flavipsychrobacter sp.]
WGKHFPGFNYFLFDHLPMYNKFRIPAMIMVIPELLFPILGIWAVSDIISGKLSNEEIWKKVKTAVLITAGLAIILGVGSRIFFSFKDADADERMAQQYGKMFNNQDAGNRLVKAIQDDRASAATKSGLLSAFYIILAGGLLWAYSKNKVKAPVLIGGLGLLIAIDLMSEDMRYLNSDAYVDSSDYDSKFEPRPVDTQINQDRDPYYRVLDLSVNTYNDAIQCYFHKCVGGYSPAKMETYQDLIDIQMNQQTGKFNTQVLNMLNTKYIILPGPNGQAGARPNPDACGNAWFVNNVKWANTADEEMLSLNANYLGDTAVVPNAFNPKITAVIRNDFKNTFGNYAFGKDSTASIKLTKYGLDDLYFTSNNSKDGLAVFSDIYYPYGWEAYVDGKETPIMRANYVLRAIKIPAGQHNIEFHFRPKSYQTGKNIAIVSSVLIIGICIGAFYQLYRKKPEVK